MGRGCRRRAGDVLECKWWKAACFRQTVNSLKCPLWLPLSGLIWWTAPIITKPQDRGITQLCSAHMLGCVCACVFPHPASCNTQGEVLPDRWPRRCDLLSSCALLQWERATPSLSYLDLRVRMTDGKKKGGPRRKERERGEKTSKVKRRST